MHLQFRLVAPIFVLVLCGSVPAQELSVFQSSEGQFAIRLPGEPQHQQVNLAKEGAPREMQHQFTWGTPEGVYLISYSDNPNLQGATNEQLIAALESGRDRLQQSFGGELLADQTLDLDQLHPGRSMRFSIPAADGIARCRMFLVDTRLYQVMAVGTRAFVDAPQTSEVLDSFRLLAAQSQ